jgi:hypothetical protein
MDVTIGIDLTPPAFPAFGMILALLLDLLEASSGPFPGPIFGYLAGHGGGEPWPGFTRGGRGSAVLVAIAMFPLVIAEALVLAGVVAVRARRRQRRDQPLHRPHTAPPAVRVTRLDCRHETC